MLALASSDVSGRGLAPSRGAGERSALPRPSWLHSIEVRCDCDYTVVKFHFVTYSEFPQFWSDPHWQVRYVYWTGQEIMYSQWMKRMHEYPSFWSDDASLG